MFWVFGRFIHSKWIALVRTIKLGLIGFKMLWKYDHNKIKIILSSVITAKDADRLCVVKSTWVKLGSVPNQRERRSCHKHF